MKFDQDPNKTKFVVAKKVLIPVADVYCPICKEIDFNKIRFKNTFEGVPTDKWRVTCHNNHEFIIDVSKYGKTTDEDSPVRKI